MCQYTGARRAILILLQRPRAALVARTMERSTWRALLVAAPCAVALTLGCGKQTAATSWLCRTSPPHRIGQYFVTLSVQALQQEEFGTVKVPLRRSVMVTPPLTLRLVTSRLPETQAPLALVISTLP